MAVFHRRALGALLATVAISPATVMADAPKSNSARGSDPSISTLLSEARKLPDGPFISPPTSQPKQITNSDEVVRARSLLERYYAINAEAQAANKSDQSKTDELSAKVKLPSPPRSRTPASDAFEPFDTKAVSGPVCKRYVICGGGTAAWAAVDAILKEDSAVANDILLITEEMYLPYNRTMLSKEMWHTVNEGKMLSSTGLRDAVEYAYKYVGDFKVSALRGARVVSVDVDDKAVELADGFKVHYDKLLLATGGVPRAPASVADALTKPGVRERVSVFRTLDDYSRLRDEATGSDAGVVVIGGGFLGTELAIALASVTRNVSLVVAEAGVLYRVLPRYLCEFLARKIDNLGVKVVRSAVVNGAEVEEEKDGSEIVTVQTLSPDASEVRGGHVVVAAGIVPETGLAKDAGLELDDLHGGVVVNDFMMAQPDVFVAGDVASFHDKTLGRRRVEHWDHAAVTGRIAAQNMLGKRTRYALQSMFWSDLDNIGVNVTAVGLVDSKLETVGVWNTAMPCIQDAPAANELLSGVVYYLQRGEIVGVVLWNAARGSGALRRARALIDARTDVSAMPDRMLGDLVNAADGSFRMYIRTKAAGS